MGYYYLPMDRSDRRPDMKISATLNAYIDTDFPSSIANFANSIKSGQDRKALDALVYTIHDFSDISSYAKVGQAKIEIEIDENCRDDLTKSAIESLRVRREEILADAQRQANEIEARIQSLLAIEYSGE